MSKIARFMPGKGGGSLTVFSAIVSDCTLGVVERKSGWNEVSDTIQSSGSACVMIGPAMDDQAQVVGVVGGLRARPACQHFRDAAEAVDPLSIADSKRRVRG